ncbi:hypothetical protein KY290_021307 [Solanum tuberosum]|uniref:Transmembrane protein n=1 Tax=Solanum tuberosum TaxID=4113 RepID=A0ABQ7V157_SOLTU|nr:hypothetical protein KY289_020462 [Solanum tuberosum]KAH0693132.1 hypothetical protein KY285_020229 [Solanum tuberosum]KAH0757814.1 hypothetical protein KY290_021307 [Solanum tuberosum]
MGKDYKLLHLLPILYYFFLLSLFFFFFPPNYKIHKNTTTPVPQNPLVNCLDEAGEVIGGLEGGCQENTTNLQDGVSKGGNISHAGHENTQIDHSLHRRTPATPQHHIQNKHQVPNRSQINATSQGQVQKIQDNNDNISGRQVFITRTSETKMKDHPDPTGDNSQQTGKDNDQTFSNNKSKGKPTKKTKTISHNNHHSSKQ